jgi:hypothetical protein
MPVKREVDEEGRKNSNWFGFHSVRGLGNRASRMRRRREAVPARVPLKTFLRPGGPTNCLLEILHQQQEVQWIGRRRLEVEVLVETARVFVLGVNQDGTYANLVCRSRCANEGILEQSCPEPFALLATIHGQTGEEDHGDRVPGEALLDSLGRFVAFNASGRKRVVADDSAVSMDNEHAGALSLMTR